MEAPLLQRPGDHQSSNPPTAARHDFTSRLQGLEAIASGLLVRGRFAVLLRRIRSGPVRLWRRIKARGHLGDRLGLRSPRQNVLHSNQDRR
jgi:hypothetical protein